GHDAAEVKLVPDRLVDVEIAPLYHPDVGPVRERVVAVNLREGLGEFESIDRPGLRNIGACSQTAAAGKAQVRYAGLPEQGGRFLDAEFLADHLALVLVVVAQLPAVVRKLEFIDERWGEGVGPVHARLRESISVNSAETRNRVRGMGLAVQRQVVAEKDAVLRAPAMIDAAHKVVKTRLFVNLRLKVCRATARILNVRGREQVHHGLPSRVWPRGDYLADVGERLHLALQQGQRVEENRLGAAIGSEEVGKITAPLRCRGHQSEAEEIPAMTQTFEGQEEEASVVAIVNAGNLDRAPEGSSKLIASEGGNFGVKEITRIEGTVAEELVHRPMEMVGARLGHHIDLRARLGAELGFVHPGLHAEFLHRIHGGRHHEGPN